MDVKILMTLIAFSASMACSPGDPALESEEQAIEPAQAGTMNRFHLDAGRPSISPDGEWIAFVHNVDGSDESAELFIARSDGRSAHQITDLTDIDNMKAPVWSPDGQWLAFHAEREGGAELYRVRVDGSDLEQVTSLGGYNVDPHWTRDGEALFFNHIDAESLVQIYRLSLSTGKAEHYHISQSNDWFPRPTPDGRIVFSSDRGDEVMGLDIYIMNPDGTQIELLDSSPGFDWGPAVSPDGSRIAFTSNRQDRDLDQAGNHDIYVMNIDGSDLRQLTDHPGQELFPLWFPDRNRLIFSSDLSGGSTAHVVDVGTGKVQRIPISE